MDLHTFSFNSFRTIIKDVVALKADLHNAYGLVNGDLTQWEELTDDYDGALQKIAELETEVSAATQKALYHDQQKAERARAKMQERINVLATAALQKPWEPSVHFFEQRLP